MKRRKRNDEYTEEELEWMKTHGPPYCGYELVEEFLRSELSKAPNRRNMDEIYNVYNEVVDLMDDYPPKTKFEDKAFDKIEVLCIELVGYKIIQEPSGFDLQAMVLNNAQESQIIEVEPEDINIFDHINKIINQATDYAKRLSKKTWRLGLGI